MMVRRITLYLTLLSLICQLAAAPVQHSTGCGSNMVMSTREKRSLSRPWPTDRPITISVYNNPRGVSIHTVENIVMECAKMWGEESGVYFQFAAKNSRGNIDIIFKRIDGNGGLHAYTGTDQFPGYSVPMVLESAEIWSTTYRRRDKGIPLDWVICHEMGHNLGLRHTFPYQLAPNIMYYDIADLRQGQDYEPPFLSQQNIDALRSIYGRRNSLSFVGGRAEKEDLEFICVPPPGNSIRGHYDCDPRRL